MNLQELIDKLPAEDRQTVIDHFVRQMLGKDSVKKEIVLRSTTKISTLGTEDEIIKEIAANLNIPEGSLKGQNISDKLKSLSVRNQSAEIITADFKKFLLKNNARKDKFEELSDLGNFLVSTNSNYSIMVPEKVDSVPDFILTGNNKKIGIEHTRLMNSESKALVKETISILKKAEQILLQKNNQLKQLVNISINYWKMNLGSKSLMNQRFNTIEKNELAELIAKFIESILFNNEIAKPSFIDKVSISERSEHPLRIEINENYLGKEECESLILSTLKAKEEKFTSYSKGGKLAELWLLVVLNEVSAPSSFIPSDRLLKNNFSSQFDKIFLFDGFSHDSSIIFSKKNIEKL